MTSWCCWQGAQGSLRVHLHTQPLALGPLQPSWGCRAHPVAFDFVNQISANQRCTSCGCFHFLKFLQKSSLVRSKALPWVYFTCFLVSRDFKDSLYAMPSQAGMTKEIRAGRWYIDFIRSQSDFSRNCAVDRAHP